MGNGLTRGAPVPAVAAFSWSRAEAVLVVLIAVHTLAVGAALVFATRWTLAFGGFAGVESVFFPRQGGAFHLVVAAGYLIEYFRHRTVTLMLIAKALAVTFLGASVLFSGEQAWSVGLSALGDGGMAVAVVLVHLKACTERARDAAATGRNPASLG